MKLIHLVGKPNDIGYHHGKIMKSAIAYNLAVYFHRFQAEWHLKKKEVLRRAEKYIDVIERYAPEYMEMMRGIGEGSEQSIQNIAVLNVRYELVYSESVRTELGRDGCTSFIALPEITANHHLFAGQNWDWIPDVLCVLLDIRTHGQHILGFTEAGIAGCKIGLNSSGLGLLVNGLCSNLDSWEHLAKPFHVRCWEILKSSNIDDAVRVVTEGNVSCSANFMFAGYSRRSAQALDIERAPDAVRCIKHKDGLLTHANHFLDPDSMGILQPLAEERKNTFRRYSRINTLLQDATRNRNLSITAAKQVFSDHEGNPESICRHPQYPLRKRYATVASILMDLTERVMFVAGGPPCRHRFVPFKL